MMVPLKPTHLLLEAGREKNKQEWALYNGKKGHIIVVDRVEWLWSPSDSFVVCFVDLKVHNVQ